MRAGAELARPGATCPIREDGEGDRRPPESIGDPTEIDPRDPEKAKNRVRSRGSDLEIVRKAKTFSKPIYRFLRVDWVDDPHLAACRSVEATELQKTQQVWQNMTRTRYETWQLPGSLAVTSAHAPPRRPAVCGGSGVWSPGAILFEGAERALRGVSIRMEERVGRKISKTTKTGPQQISCIFMHVSRSFFTLFRYEARDMKGLVQVQLWTHKRDQVPRESMYTPRPTTAWPWKRVFLYQRVRPKGTVDDGSIVDSDPSDALRPPLETSTPRSEWRQSRPVRSPVFL